MANHINEFNALVEALKETPESVFTDDKQASLLFAEYVADMNDIPSVKKGELKDDYKERLKDELINPYLECYELSYESNDSSDYIDYHKEVNDIISGKIANPVVDGSLYISEDNPNSGRVLASNDKGMLVFARRESDDDFAYNDYDDDDESDFDSAM